MGHTPIAPGDERAVREALDARFGGERGAVRGAGLHGGAQGAGPCLDTRKLASVLDVDSRGGLVSAQAGVTVGELRRVLRAESMTLAHWGPLPEEATLGGLLGRAWPTSPSWYRADVQGACAGLQAMTWEGAACGYVPAPRKSSGPDLRGLFIGARGQGGVITAAHMAALPLPEACVTLRAAGEAAGLLEAMMSAAREGAQPWRAHLWATAAGASLEMTFAGASPLVGAAAAMARAAVLAAAPGAEVVDQPDDVDGPTATLLGLTDAASALAMEDTLYAPWRAPSWAEASGQGHAQTLRAALACARGEGVGVLIAQPSPTDASALLVKLSDTTQPDAPHTGATARATWVRLPWRWTLPATHPSPTDTASADAPAWLRRLRATPSP